LGVVHRQQDGIKHDLYARLAEGEQAPENEIQRSQQVQQAPCHGHLHPQDVLERVTRCQKHIDASNELHVAQQGQEEHPGAWHFLQASLRNKNPGSKKECQAEQNPDRRPGDHGYLQTFFHASPPYYIGPVGWQPAIKRFQALFQFGYNFAFIWIEVVNLVILSSSSVNYYLL